MTTELPVGVEHARTTDRFDQDNHPAGLLRAHRVANGVWGRLVVEDGALDFVFEDDADNPITATPHRPVVIPPGRLHHVEFTGPVSFAIEFHREVGAETEEGSESTGLAES